MEGKKKIKGKKGKSRRGEEVWRQELEGKGEGTGKGSNQITGERTPTSDARLR